MWWLIAPGALGCLAVLVTAAKLSAGKHPLGRHVQAGQAELCAHCGNPALGYARGRHGERLCHHEDRDCYRQVTVYGSMIWDEERRLHGPGASTTLLPAPPLAGSMILADEEALRAQDDPQWKVRPDPRIGPHLGHPLAIRQSGDPVPWEGSQSDARIKDGQNWREQTAADLSPEALDVDEAVERACESDRLAVAIEMGWPDSQVTTDGSAPGWLGAEDAHCHSWPDSGPGAGSSSLTAPGPDPEHIHNGSCSDTRCWNGGPGRNPDEPSRLADTGDIMDARLLADVQADMRARDDDARAYCSALDLWRRDCMRQLRADLAGARA